MNESLQRNNDREEALMVEAVPVLVVFRINLTYDGHEWVSLVRASGSVKQCSGISLFIH